MANEAYRRPMCACADNEANWRGHGLSARYVCTCGGTTTSAKGLTWQPEPDDHMAEVAFQRQRLEDWPRG